MATNNVQLYEKESRESNLMRGFYNAKDLENILFITS